jgi:hypothetical protein
VRQGRPERNRTARSFRQLRRFHHVINSDKVFGTHRATPTLHLHHRSNCRRPRTPRIRHCGPCPIDTNAARDLAQPADARLRRERIGPIGARQNVVRITQDCALHRWPQSLRHRQDARVRHRLQAPLEGISRVAAPCCAPSTRPSSRIRNSSRFGRWSIGSATTATPSSPRRPRNTSTPPDAARSRATCISSSPSMPWSPPGMSTR